MMLEDTVYIPYIPDIPEDVDVNSETRVCTIQAQMVAPIIRLMLVLMTCSTNKLCPGTVGWGEGGVRVGRVNHFQPLCQESETVGCRAVCSNLSRLRPHKPLDKDGFAPT